MLTYSQGQEVLVKLVLQKFLQKLYVALIHKMEIRVVSVNHVDLLLIVQILLNLTLLLIIV